MARSAPDGHTLLAISNTHVINETLVPTRTYRLLTDFKPVIALYTSEHAVFVSNKVPAKTLAEFVALAKKDPGKLTFASSGPGSTYHLAGELFKARAGVDLLHVPYRGSAQARTDLIGGQVDAFFDLVAPMAPQVKAGNIKVLATTGAKRSNLMPDVPTVIEAGVPNYTAEAWCALLAPAGTPDDVIERIRQEVSAFQKTAEADKIAEIAGHDLDRRQREGTGGFHAHRGRSLGDDHQGGEFGEGLTAKFACARLAASPQSVRSAHSRGSMIPELPRAARYSRSNHGPGIASGLREGDRLGGE